MLMKKAVCEHFVGFFDISSDRDAKVLTSVMMRTTGNYSSTNNLICQTYDGGSCMSGQHSGVPALVKSHCLNVLSIHCYAFKFSLVLAQGINKHSSSQTVSCQP